MAAPRSVTYTYSHTAIRTRASGITVLARDEDVAPKRAQRAFIYENAASVGVL